MRAIKICAQLIAQCLNGLDGLRALLIVEVVWNLKLDPS
jgi:hypothetical protein